MTSKSTHTIHESPGRPCRSGRGGKWGVLVATRSSCCASMRVHLPPELDGRAIALDLIIPSANGGAITHRLIGAYAPWDPGSPEDGCRAFWPRITEFCLNSRNSWSLVGDLNATISSSETMGDYRVTASRIAYEKFLHEARGCDAWNNIPDRSVDRSYTYCFKTVDNQVQSKCIIDRLAFSTHAVISSTIETLSTFIPGTDHRAIKGCVILRTSTDEIEGVPSIDDLQIPRRPRHKYPPKAEKFRFEAFSSRVDELIAQSNKLRDQHSLETDEDFEETYEALSTVLHQAADESFILPKLFIARKPTNSTLRYVVTELRRVNRIISFAKKSLRNPYLPFLPPTRWALSYYSAFHSSPALNHSVETFIKYLADIRRCLNKLRYAEERNERKKRNDNIAFSQIKNVLTGGSAKKLYPHQNSPLPLALAPSTDSSPEEIVTGESSVKALTIRYFQDLYQRTPRPPQQKPWLSSPSVANIASRTASDPFEWPHPLSLEDLRLLLKRGNTRPTPGPDGWEKWWLLHLSDDSLRIVQSLTNYIILNSHFPSCIKHTHLTTIHKKNSVLCLQNYRGISCSNVLANLPFAWLTFRLTPYVAKHRIVPQSQIATQPGVQGRDLLSFIAHVQTWATRCESPLYILQRDQKKGFDMLEPAGFYDALDAYGLPSSIADLDRSSQQDVPYAVKTAYGLTSFFPISGVTKQGGSLSPLKCTLTTSLVNHWLSDRQGSTDGEVILSSTNARLGRNHEPNDSIRQPVSMVEAMDDSLLFSASLPNLISFSRDADRFQATYGWETAWSKSTLYAFNTPEYASAETPNHANVPSVDPSNPSSSCTDWHEVLVNTSHITFLRVPINEPRRHFDALRDLILSFRFPVLNRKLPITALRRILSSCLVSKIRPRLYFQPLPISLAKSLDSLIAEKVHSYLGMPFRFDAKYLFGSFTDGGMEFPSIERINSAALISGVARDLNHSVEAFRNAARITLADWSCQYNHCNSPLCLPTTPPSSMTIRHLETKISSSWLHASLALKKIGLSIPSTDNSHIIFGDVSLLHIYNQVSHSCPNFHFSISSRVFNNFARHNFRTLSSVGRWAFNDSCPLPSLFVPYVLQFDHNVSYLSRDWPLLHQWLSHLPKYLQYLSFPDSMLLLPRVMRQTAAETAISYLPPFPSPFAITDHLLPLSPALLASDGSSSSSNNHKQTFFAILSNGHTSVASLSAYRETASSQLAEAYGILAAHLHARDNKDCAQVPNKVLYTDHLPSVNIINNQSSKPSSLTNNPARSIYRWVNSVRNSFSSYVPHITPPAIKHVRAHTDATDLPSKMNQVVDFAASHARFANPLATLPVPVPTFAMDDYTPYTTARGFFESNLNTFVLDAYMQTQKPLTQPSMLSRHLYDTTPSPTYMYTSAASAYSAMVQLYVRSSQLDTNINLACRFNDGHQPWCRFGCRTFETPNHIFCLCPRFCEIRDSSVATLKNSISSLLDLYKSSLDAHPDLKNAINSTFTNSTTWPTGRSTYFLGLIPNVDALLDGDKLTHLNTLALNRLHIRIAHDWHTAAIRTAGRIWGLVRSVGYEHKGAKENRHRSPQMDMPLPTHLQSLF